MQEFPWPHGSQGWAGVPGVSIHSCSLCVGRHSGRPQGLWSLSASLNQVKASKECVEKVEALEVMLAYLRSPSKWALRA